MWAKPREHKLFTLIHYQRYLGLTDIDYSTVLNCYVLNGNWCSYSIQFLMMLVCIASFIDAQAKAHLEMHSKTGNLVYGIITLAIPVAQLLVYIWLRSKQESQRVLLQMLTQLACRLKVNTFELALLRRLYRFWLGICAFYFINLIFAHLYLNTNSHKTYVFFFVNYYALLLRINYIITLYTSLVHLVLVLLEAQADQLLIGSQISLEELANSLRTHDELLLLCQEGIIKVFGGAVIICLLYYLMDATFVCYVSSLTERFSFAEVLFVLSWLIPFGLYLGMPLIFNNLAKQVSFVIISVEINWAS